MFTRFSFVAKNINFNYLLPCSFQSCQLLILIPRIFLSSGCLRQKLSAPNFYPAIQGPNTRLRYVYHLTPVNAPLSQSRKAILLWGITRCLCLVWYFDFDQEFSDQRSDQHFFNKPPLASISCFSESVAISKDGSLFLLDKFGSVWRAPPDGKGGFFLETSTDVASLGPGRPLGAHFDSSGNLIICDALKASAGGADCFNWGSLHFCYAAIMWL